MIASTFQFLVGFCRGRGVPRLHAPLTFNSLLDSAVSLRGLAKLMGWAFNSLLDSAVGLVFLEKAIKGFQFLVGFCIYNIILQSGGQL